MTAYHPAAQSLQGLLTVSMEIELRLSQRLGLNLTDYRAVSTLSQAPPVTVGQLADALGTTPATTTAIVNRLEKGGFVARHRDDSDRRHVRVSVTAEGYQRIMALMRPLLTATNDHLWSLDADRQAAIADFLDVTRGQMHDHLLELSGEDPR